MDHLGERVVAALGPAAAGELLEVLERPDADRAALIRRLWVRDDAAWFAELLMDLEDEVGEVARFRLVDRRTRVVEVLGPELPGSRRPTDRELLFERPDQASYLLWRPQPVGFCFQADGRRARFLVNEGQWGDALLDLLASRPKTPARPARPYGVRGWLVEG